MQILLKLLLTKQNEVLMEQMGEFNLTMKQKVVKM